MKTTLGFVITFLIFFSAEAQTRIGLGLGMSYQKVGMVTLNSTNPTLRPFIQIDHYFKYRYALYTGVGYFHVGYSTLGHSSDLLMYGTNVDPTRINNRWKQSMIQVPLGIRIGPQTYPLNMTFGVDLNFTVKSQLWDLKGNQNTSDYVVTDVTKAVRPLNVCPFAMITYMVGPVTFNTRYLFFNGNWYSSKAAILADENAKNSGGYWRSWYSSYGNLLQLYPAVDLNITYRIR